MLLRWEIIAVFAVSLGASGVYAFVSLIGSLTARHALSSQSVTLNGSQAPGPPAARPVPAAGLARVRRRAGDPRVLPARPLRRRREVDRHRPLAAAARLPARRRPGRADRRQRPRPVLHRVQVRHRAERRRGERARHLVALPGPVAVRAAERPARRGPGHRLPADPAAQARGPPGVRDLDQRDAARLVPPRTRASAASSATR